MEYNKLVAVTGLPGLFELVSSKTDGAIVRSLEEKTTKFAASRKHQFSHLESIEIYTVSDNVNLVEIFKAMDKATEALPDAKDNKAIKSYFEKVYPEMDFDRVYNSDMKKMVKWFDILKKNNIEIKLTEPEEEIEVEATEAVTEEKTEKPAASKDKKTTTAEAPAKEKAAAKKAPAKKKAAAKKKDA
ncbi:MAG: DUF5606 domain-containing protein [Niabella sp.]